MPDPFDNIPASDLSRELREAAQKLHDFTTATSGAASAAKNLSGAAGNVAATHPLARAEARYRAQAAAILGGNPFDNIPPSALSGDMRAASQRLGAFASAAPAAEAAGGALSAAGAVAKLAEWAVKAADGLNKMADEQQRYNHALARSSAQMALVQAEGRVRTIQREREVGDRLSASARNLTQSDQGYQDSTKELRILWNATENRVGAAWADLKRDLLGPLNDIARQINEWMGNTKGAGNLSFGEWMQQTRDQDRQRAAERFGPRWENPPGDDRGRVGGGGRGHGGDFGG